MLTYTFKDQNMPMYEYLYQCIKNDIIHQKLKPHEKLPSKRAFAKNQNVSLITIENAYHQLLIEGFIYSQERKGYFVSDLHYPHYIKNHPSLITKSKQPHYRIDLKSNSISPTHFPFSTWSKIARQVLSSQSPELLSRSPNQGCESLRRAICSHLYAFCGMNVSPEQVIIGAGSEYLYNLVIQLLGREQIYGLENPGHHSISQVYYINQVKYHYIPLDQQGIDMYALKKSQARIVHISPAHHFPTGITMPIQRRLELLQWAEESHGYIIEDDYDSEFRMRGKPLSPLFQIDQNEHVIYMNTFSKTLAPSFRISYMILPPHLVHIFQQKLGFYTCSVSSFEQMILAEFIQKHHFEKHINRMRNNYKSIRDEFLLQLSQNPLFPQITITEENSGLHFLLHFSLPYSDELILKRAQDLGINMSMLSQFYDHSFDSHTIVINYSGLSIEDIPLAVQLLCQLLII